MVASVARFTWLRALLAAWLLISFDTSSSTYQVSSSPSSPDRDQHHGPDLCSAAFELVAEVRDLQTGAYITLEERYSAGQARGLLRQRVHYASARVNESLAAGEDSWRELAGSTRTHWVDARQAVSVVHSDGANTCARFEPDSVLRALNIDFVEFDTTGCGHVFGAARLLHHIGRVRPELRADVSGARYFTRNAPSFKYSKLFASPSRGKLRLDVFFSEAAMEPSTRASALPVAVHINWLERDVRGLVIELAPIKFTGDNSLAEDLHTDLKLDALAIDPWSGCALAITKRRRFPWSATDEGIKPNRFSFRASVRTLYVKSPGGATGRDAASFDVQVAYDAWVNKMRVDLRAPPGLPVARSTQIFDFALDKMTHILARPQYGRRDFVEDLIQPERLARPSSPGAPLGAGRPAADYFRCANADINSLCVPMTLTLDNLLLGTSGEFVYLGLARVRGVPARVYQVHDSQLPFWLDPQMFRRDHSPASEQGSVQVYSSSRPPKHHYVTLVYLSECATTEQASVLLVEIYELDPSLRAVLSKRQIDVFDFGWNLQAMRAWATVGGSIATSGELALSLFSLVHFCTEWTTNLDDQAASESHASFEMLLQSAERLSPTDLLWLREHPTELRVTLLDALQLQLHLIFGLVYDLETRLMATLRPANQTALDPSNPSQPSLLATFKVGRLPTTLNIMLYMGQGRRKPNRSWFLRVFSQQECFMIAAHLKYEAEFAHDPKSSSCYIAMKPHERTDKEGGAFEMSTTAEMSVFKALKAREYHKVGREWWLNAPLRQDYQSRGLRLYLDFREKPVKMNIERLKVEHHAPTLVDGRSRESARPGVLVDFKLSQSDSLNRLVTLVDDSHSSGASSRDADPDSAATLSEERMTLGQCQAVCQGDFDCKSFSYCTNGARPECILSRADLGRPGLVDDIAAALKSNQQQVNLELAPGEMVALTRRRNCAVRMKQYLDLYKADGQMLVTSARFDSLQAASSVEECARVCFQHMQASLLDGRVQRSDPLDRLHQGAASGEQEPGAAEPLIRPAQTTTGCFSFWYIEADNFGKLSKTGRTSLDYLFERAPGVNQIDSSESKRAKTEKDKETLDGYCALSRLDSQVVGGGPEKYKMFAADHYFLMMDSMYEAAHGTRLKQAALSSVESAAFIRVKQSAANEADPASVDTVRRVLARGDNFQLVISADREQCAQACFTQSAGLWPHCGSFDVVYHKQYGTTRTTCVLNSLSMSQAIEFGRLDLIDSSHGFDKNEQRWHFEPRAGLMSRQQVQWTAKAMQALSPGSKHGLGNPFDPVALGISAFLGIVLGLTLAVLAKSTVRRASVSSTTSFAMR